MRSYTILIICALLLAGCSLTPQSAAPSGQISAIEAAGGSGAAGFARATAPRPFVFPQDHGPHQEFATEWWYYTGNLDTAEGRHFGFQLTFFRFGLAPQPPERPSDWGAANIYMAHFALTDAAGQKFYAFDRFSRGAAGLAGAQAEPFRVWLEDWSAEGVGGAPPMRLRAAQGGAAIDLTLEGGKPVVPQGDRGLSQKGPEPGNASYYYSLTRMPARGSISAGGASYTVTGLAWMDREWSTSSLSANLAGWDWFALQLSDGREVMYYQLRDKSGAADPLSAGTIIAADGTPQRFARADLTLDVLGTWQSPRSGGRYPSGWRLRIPSAALDLTVTPYLPDQELALTTVYWEGASKVGGTAGGQPVSGNGYVELTGYAEQTGQDNVRVR
jgi:predicted secreted hydrolase